MATRGDAPVVVVDDDVRRLADHAAGHLLDHAGLRVIASDILP